MALRNECQIWDGPNSVIVTQVLDYAQEKVCHVFLAAGDGKEIAAMQEPLARWAKAQGCTKAQLVGRKGWARVLQSAGWTLQPDIVMVRHL